MTNKTIKIHGVKVILTPFGARIYTKDFNLFKSISRYIKNEGIKYS